MRPEYDKGKCVGYPSRESYCDVIDGVIQSFIRGQKKTVETHEKTQPGKTVWKPEFRPVIPHMRDSILFFIFWLFSILVSTKLHWLRYVD